MTGADWGLVAGGGSIGKRHARNLQNLGVEVAVTDHDPESCEEATAELGVSTFTEISAALDAVSPDFVVVCAPNRFHIDLATKAANAGCHLFIEKPLSHEMAGVANLTELVAEQNLVSLVGCNLRFQPKIRKIHELLQNDVIGPVVAARIEGGSYLPEWFPDSDYRGSCST
jgi:predicted dehydrogenase